MKTLKSTLSLLFCLHFMQLSLSAPHYEIIYDTITLYSTPNYHFDDLYYLSSDDGSLIVFNYTSKDIYPVHQVGNCSNIPPYITLDLEIWCIGFNSSQNTYSMNLLSPNGTEVVSGYLVPETFSSTYTGLMGNYLFIEEMDAPYKIRIFDTKAKELVCKDIRHGYKPPAFWFTGEAMIYIGADQKGDVKVEYWPCSGEEPITSSPPAKKFINNFIFGLNESSALLNCYIAEAFTCLPFIYDKMGLIHFFEPIMDPSFLLQLNDTHLFGAKYLPGDEKVLSVGLYVLSPEMKIVEVASFSPGISSKYIEASPLIGTSSVVFGLDNSKFEFDFSDQKIKNVETAVPPIVLEDQTVINITQQGYLIQHPGDDIRFVPVPMQVFFQSFADPHQVYTFFIPDNSSQYKNCTLMHYNVTSSEISKTDFPFCYGSVEYIFDVAYDIVGNLAVVYSDSSRYLYTITTEKAHPPLSIFRMERNFAISIDLNTGIGTFIGGHDKYYISVIFSFTNGTVYSSEMIMGGERSYPYKLFQNYFMLVNLYQDSTEFLIWDALEQTVVHEMNASINMPISGVPEELFVMNIDVSSPNFYSAIVYLDDQDMISIVNQKGEVTEIESTFQGFLWPAGRDSFFVCSLDYNNFLAVKTLYSVVSYDN